MVQQRRRSTAQMLQEWMVPKIVPVLQQLRIQTPRPGAGVASMVESV